MERERLETLSKWFEDYAMSFADSSGRLPKAMERKLLHTRDVRRAAARIASSSDGASLSGGLLALAEAGGLLHDVARFEQFKKHRTFADRKSFDHGDFGASLIESFNLCEGLDEDEGRKLIASVKLHNKMTLPEELDSGTRTLCEVVRDADKVAILQLVADYLENESKYEDDPSISLEAPDTGTFSFDLAKTVLEGEMIRYKDIRSRADFLISLFAWPVDLNFKESARILLEDGAYYKIGKFIPPAPIIDEMMDVSSLRLLEKAGMAS